MRPTDPRYLSATLALTLLTSVIVPMTVVAAEATSMAEAVSGLELRSIGPAIMGGRIADIAVDPRDSSTWFLAVGSGGVWKTDNAGVTWAPIFDDQPSYSIGSRPAKPGRCVHENCAF